MTGYTVHTGSTEKFSDGWDRIFGTQNKQQKTSAAKTTASQKKAGSRSGGKGGSRRNKQS